MEIAKVKNDIKTGKFDNFYIFAGDEGYTIKTYINMIVKKTGYKLEYVDSVTEVYSKLKVKSLVPVHYVYVVLNDREFSNSKYEARWDRVTRDIKNDILIVQYTDVDKRIKFWKHFKDRAVFFNILDNRILKKQIQKWINLSDKNCDRLIEICEHDLGRILLEVDKIRRYAEWNVTLVRNIYNNAFEIMLKYDIIYQPPKDAIFDFAGAVMNHDIPLVYELYEQCRLIGESNMALISVLYSNFRNLLQVQTSGNKDIGKSTGLSGWYIKIVKPYVDVYTDDEIVDILLLLRKIEKGIKIGEISESISIEYALSNIL